MNALLDSLARLRADRERLLAGTREDKYAHPGRRVRGPRARREWLDSYRARIAARLAARSGQLGTIERKIARLERRLGLGSMTP